MEDKIIGSEQTPSPQKGVLATDGETQLKNKTETPVNAVDAASEIYKATKNGGLTEVPPSFEEVNGNWTTIRSANPFEVLYLDYQLYHQITPEMVKKNYDVLSAFWQGKMRLMMGGAREKIKARYGEEPISNAPKFLDKAYEKLKTAEGITLYYAEVEKKRYNAGIAAITELADLSLDDGELTRKEAARIITKAADNKLTENEATEYLLARMKEANMKPRASTTTHENVFDSQWMTDSRWNEYKTRQTEWLNTTVSTLEQVGEVTFANKDKAYQRLTNANYLPVVIARLTNDNKGYEFEQIINKEPDADKRFLKVVYRLNPSLPFRLDGVRFENVKDILAVTADSYATYSNLYHSFQRGHLQIWLTETDPSTAAMLTAGTAYTDFLHFVFRMNKAHPFYLKEHRFATPEAMAAAASQQASLWPLIAGGMYHNELPAWFAGIDRYNQVKEYNKQYDIFADSPYHTTRDKEMAAVQTLLQVIDPTLPSPQITAEPQQVQMLTVEGSDQVQLPVEIRLTNTGFVKVKLQLSANINGIRLSENELTLHSQNGVSSGSFYVYVDGMALVKNKLYSLNIVVQTAYQQVKVPLEIKVVFPQKKYTRLLIKYAAFGALFFGGIRYLLGVLINNTGSLSNSFFDNYLSFDTPPSHLPSNYFFFVLVLIGFIVCLPASVSIIKKSEKL